RAFREARFGAFKIAHVRQNQTAGWRRTTHKPGPPAEPKNEGKRVSEISRPEARAGKRDKSNGPEKRGTRGEWAHPLQQEGARWLVASPNHLKTQDLHPTYTHPSHTSTGEGWLRVPTI